MSDGNYPRYRLRNPYYEALLREGTATAPIGAHSQGLSRMAFALLSGLERNDLDPRERNARAAMQLMGGEQKRGEQSGPVLRWPV
jgi:hypothetical protein